MSSTDTKQLWNNAMAEIEMNISRPNFVTWFKNTAIDKKKEGVVHIMVPNEFVKEWLVNKYHKLILKSLRDLSDDVHTIEYTVISREKQKERRVEEPVPVSYNSELPLNDLYINKEDNLNPRYSFESFVVCPFNQMAYAASEAIVKNPGSAYNPFFLYGDTGLGKTHLIQAIGNKIKNESPVKQKIFYTSSEKFYLDYVTSVQTNTTPKFKEKYRQFDVLIMDDVQFLSGKKETQNEFFHLFNSLYDNNKQIIFSSDKHYNYIPNIESRIKSRFSAGMIIDLSEPDFESRVAILRSKIQERNITLVDDGIEVIAEKTNGSIRELEGILNSIIAQSQFKNQNLSLNEIRSLIKNNDKPKRSVTVDDVVHIVADFYSVEKEVISQKTRRKEIVKPRQIIMYILREDFDVSFPTIGQKLGGRDHTTVIHSCEKIKKELKINGILNQEIEQIRSML